MITINNTTIKWLPKIKAAKNFFAAFFQRYGTASRCWIAGGAILDYFMWSEDKFCLYNKDLDIYSDNTISLEVLASELANTDYNYIQGPTKKSGGSTDTILKLAAKTPINYFKQIDIINVTYDSPQAVLDDFDFTVTKAAIWSDGLSHMEFCCDDNYFQHIEQKQLVHNGKVFHPNLFARVSRYAEKGFNISRDHSYKLFETFRSRKLSPMVGPFDKYTIEEGAVNTVTVKQSGSVPDTLPFLEETETGIAL